MMRRPLVASLVLLSSLLLTGPAWLQTVKASDKNRRPTVTLRASPAIAFSPARVNVTAELRGGADDYEDFYCPTIEWDWGDGTRSEARADCDPYEAGTSEIKRRYIADHTYRYGGQYRLTFRLKRENKVLGSSNASVQIRPGVRDIYGQ
jgi:hypothetical protein